MRALGCLARALVLVREREPRSLGVCPSVARENPGPSNAFSIVARLRLAHLSRRPHPRYKLMYNKYPGQLRRRACLYPIIATLVRASAFYFVEEGGGGKQRVGRGGGGESRKMLAQIC